jgi:hypothetical protein
MSKQARKLGLEEVTEDRLVELWFLVYDASVLLSIARDLEDDERYAERARQLVALSDCKIMDGLALLEEILGWA